ncbi:helix-turn-helix domain-containing protein [Hymenobacter mucosus]|uniref:Helix-turn-helix n=1 Tax=Hymenobacter mucosus TaxID=1411120 RepID=A0A239A7B0_9BACT|nr:helix-turn-helix transcriptional regulator [Hymenobacter mucosus]SNR91389.1 Helix-turn-helix [Hymenobacter mucosus]
METTPGKRIQIFREYKGYRKAAPFAEAAGLKAATLSSIETDRTAPSFDTLAALTTAFPDLNPDWLLTGTGTMLRDGRVLTPVVSEERSPARKDMAAVAESQEVIYLKQQLATERQQREWMQSIIDQLIGGGSGKELPGKLYSNDYAAVEMVAPGFKFGKQANAVVSPSITVLGNISPLSVGNKIFYTTEDGELKGLEVRDIQSVIATPAPQVDKTANAA